MRRHLLPFWHSPQQHSAAPRSSNPCPARTGPAGDLPAPTASKLLARIGADRRALAKVRAQITRLDRSPEATRVAQLQAQMDQYAKVLETLSRLMQKSHETSQSVINNIKG